MKEDPIREKFPQLLSKAFSLGLQQYNPGYSDLGQAMMGALMEVMHWLHKEHRLYLVVKPRPGDANTFYRYEIVQVLPNSSHLLDYTRESDLKYDDWPTAYVEGLDSCLKIVELTKVTKDDDD